MKALKFDLHNGDVFSPRKYTIGWAVHYTFISFEETCIMIAVLSIRLFCGTGGKAEGPVPLATE